MLEPSTMAMVFGDDRDRTGMLDHWIKDAFARYDDELVRLQHFQALFLDMAIDGEDVCMESERVRLT